MVTLLTHSSLNKQNLSFKGLICFTTISFFIATAVIFFQKNCCLVNAEHSVCHLLKHSDFLSITELQINAQLSVDECKIL